MNKHSTHENISKVLAGALIAVVACDVDNEEAIMASIEFEENELDDAVLRAAEPKNSFGSSTDAVEPQEIGDVIDRDERWEDGFEEWLDLDCDEDDCEWAWAGPEQVELELGYLPEFIPPTSDRIGAASAGAANTVAAAGYQGAGTKTLSLDYIRCYSPQELTGDELYIKVNGVVIWSESDVDFGETHFIDEDTQFSTGVEVQLFEDDVALDDHLGSVFVSSYTSNGNWGQWIEQGDALYRIYYSVTG